jgi:hypothetical protein
VTVMVVATDGGGDVGGVNSGDGGIQQTTKQ